MNKIHTGIILSMAAGLAGFAVPLVPSSHTNAAPPETTVPPGISDKERYQTEFAPYIVRSFADEPGGMWRSLPDEWSAAKSRTAIEGVFTKDVQFYRIVESP